MAGMHGHSEACCTVPAVKADYKEKGTFIKLKDGRECYTTGPSSAAHALFVVPDIFGFKAQTLQGADILAHTDDQHHQYQVFIPDFFDGKPFPLDAFPPSTDEQKKMLGDFFGGPANPQAVKDVVPRLVDELTARSQGAIQKWGLVGYCWGGKIVSLVSGAGTKVAAAAECHPAMVDAADAEKIAVPICMLPSGDEDKDDVKKFMAALKVKGRVETFADQVHGWMAARADLSNPRVKEEYERGYKILLDFFHENI